MTSGPSAAFPAIMAFARRREGDTISRVRDGSHTGRQRRIRRARDRRDALDHAGKPEAG